MNPLLPDTERTTAEPPSGAGLDGLFARCCAGERPAIRTLYELHIRRVMALARRLGLPAEETEDVAQDVFSVALRDLPRIVPAAFPAYLHQLVSHRVTDRQRRRRVRERFARWFSWGAEEDPAPSPEQRLAERDSQRRVAEILARMSPKKRDVFALYELEELGGDAIAERLQIPLATVWTRLHHARRDFARLGRALALFEEARADTRGAAR